MKKKKKCRLERRMALAHIIRKLRLVFRISKLVSRCAADRSLMEIEDWAPEMNGNFVDGSYFVGCPNNKNNKTMG